jgi:oxygen-dependent protoporphyrinogen oxidase
VVVIGGGIAGLAAAYAVSRDAPAGTSVTVIEATGALGGKLRTSEIAGLAVDEGAESLLARVPEAVGLARAVGLGPELVTPATTTAGLWSRGRLRPLPEGTVMGVPADLTAVARSRVLTARGVARAALDLALPANSASGDRSVAAVVGSRLGREVVDRLVEPLLGGVYAGRADQLSFAATLPQLAGNPAEPSLLRRARSVRAAAAARRSDPVFSTVPGGLGRLVAAVAAASGAEILLRRPARELTRAGAVGGWRIVLGATTEAEVLSADAIVVAVPAGRAARLLATVTPAAAAELAGIDYASVAVVTLAWPTAGWPTHLAGSGFLVPAEERRLIKGVTFSSRKWAHLAVADPALTIVRASVGRHGDTADLQRDDAELARLAVADLRAATGALGRPVATRVTRWGGGLPQYAPGHLDRVARIKSAVEREPGLAVCGAAYDGIGIAACIRSANAAAARVVRFLAEAPPTPAVGCSPSAGQC